jgi:hypothetical protein
MVGIAALLIVLLLPVPWLHVVSDNPPGHAWRLNGRLYIDGDAIDPAGDWSWLAVGRPPVVAELLRDRIVGTDSPPADMRRGSRTRSPALSEPAAVAVGLRHAGVDVPMRLLVEASHPQYEGLPERAVITEVAGVELTVRADWDRVVDGWEIARAAASDPSSDPSSDLSSDPSPVASSDLSSAPSSGSSSVASSGETSAPPTVDFEIRDGRNFSTPGPGLPYDRVDILDLAPVDLDAAISAPLTRLAPVSWFRKLSLGSSHGMMVALMTYTHASGRDLAQTRHIAGTGGIQGDGTVTRIGGLPAKAKAAKRAGADVLFFPASQVGELESFDRDGITLVPIETLDDAIRWLSNPLT